MDIITSADIPAFTPVAPVRPAILHTDFSSPAGLASFTHNR